MQQIATSTNFRFKKGVHYGGGGGFQFSQFEVLATAAVAHSYGGYDVRVVEHFVEGGLLVAPQPGSPASLDRSTGCCVALRTQEHSLAHSGLHLSRGAKVSPSAPAKV